MGVAAMPRQSAKLTPTRWRNETYRPPDQTQNQIRATHFPKGAEHDVNGRMSHALGEQDNRGSAHEKTTLRRPGVDLATDSVPNNQPRNRRDPERTSTERERKCM